MHCCRALTLALARLYCTVGRHAAACLCRTWARLGLMSSGCLLYCCSSGPAQMMTQMMTSHFVIFHAIQRRKFHAFIHKKASTSGGRSPTTSTRSLTGALPLGPTGGLPRPRYFTPGRYSEGGYGGWTPEVYTKISAWIYLYAEWPIIDISTSYFSRF